ncbi:hypothetical protein ACTJKO_16330 [Curtobacterium sp. 22159]|uniref:hypothetical protein n=1 Tax=Curtobacterium sp. 22159 TaxID=3453882 RepID=UPI003F878BBE
MQHESTPPFRFRTPPGWPTPSAEWVELHQAAEPAADWSPAPGIPAAPAGWRFWSVVPRSFRAYLPPRARRLRVAQWTGLVVALVALAGVLVVTAVGGPSVLALVPLVAGVAVLVVASSRRADLAARTAASVRDDAAAWRPTEVPSRARAARPDLDEDAAVAAWEAAAWGLATAHPFVTAPTQDGSAVAPGTVPASIRRGSRAVFGLTAGVAALLLVVGAGASVVPVVHAAQQFGAGSTLAYGWQGDPGPGDGDSSGPDQSDQSTWTSDDGTITAKFISDDDTWQATCGATDFTENCSAWTIGGECDGSARITIGFADAEGGADVRTDTRTVLLTAGTPLILTEPGPEAWSDIEDATCSAPAKSPVAVTRKQLDSDDEDADGSWPDGCVDFGCAGWEITPEADCPSATVLFSVDEEVGTLPAPHDLVVTTALHAGKPVDVWAGGAWSSDDDATLAQVTCG